MCSIKKTKRECGMKLYDRVLYYWISRNFTTEYHENGEEILLSAPLLLEQERELSGHVVLTCAADTEGWKTPLSRTLLLCLGQPACSAEQLSDHVLILPEETSEAKVMNVLCEVFELFSRWEATVLRAMDEEWGFSAIVNSCDMLVEDPLALSDTRFRYIAYSKMAVENGFEARYVGPDGGLSPSDVDYLISQPGFKELESRRDEFYDQHFENVIHKNVFYRDAYVGRLGLPFTDDTVKNQYYQCILRYVARYVEQLYARYGSFRNELAAADELQKMLAEYLDGVRPELDLSLLQASGFRSGDQYCLVQFQLNTEKNLYGAYLMQQVGSARWEGSCCFSCDCGVLALVDLTEYRQAQQKDFAESLKDFLRSNRIQAGVSRCFRDWNALHPAFRQTDTALKLGRIEDPGGLYYPFDAYAFQRLLRSGVEGFTPEQIAAPSLLALRQYDRENGTAFCETLRSFIRCRYNASLAARELYIARSTFLNRMERIAELTEQDMEDWDARLYLELSLKLLEA